MTCPHDHIRFCPLYIAAHIAGAPGCDDGRLAEQTCAVARDMDYAQARATLAAQRPRLVAEAAFLEAAHQARRGRPRHHQLVDDGMLLRTV